MNTSTCRQYQEEVKTVAKAFIKLGPKPHHSVNILSSNCSEWHCEKKQSYQHHKDAMEGKNTNSLGYSIAKKAVFSKVQCFT